MAARELTQRHLGKIYNQALRLTKNTHDANVSRNDHSSQKSIDHHIFSKTFTLIFLETARLANFAAGTLAGYFFAIFRGRTPA